MVVCRRTGYRLFFPPRQHLYFVHVPKCGGSYVAGTFGRTIDRCPTNTLPEARGHRTYLEYRDIFQRRGMNFGAAPSFAVVRNPWDWHVSWFYYIKGDQGGRKSGHRLEHELFQRFQFAGYLTWLEDPYAARSPQGYIVRQVSDWIVDEQGRIAVSYVLRQERLKSDLERLVSELDLRVTVRNGTRNTSQHDDYHRYYTDNLVECVARRHARDIALLGYSF